MALNQREIMALAATSKRQQYGCGDGLNIIVEPAHKGLALSGNQIRYSQTL